MLYKRGEVWHFDFTVKGRRFRGSTWCRLKADAAKVEERERRAALLGGLHEPLTLEEAADQWFAARQAGKKSARTTAQRIKIMLRHYGADTLITEIGARQITEAINARRVEPIVRGRNQTAELPSNATVNRDLIDTTLRPIMRFASKNLELPIKDIPWADLRLEEPRNRVRWYSDAEREAFRDALPHWHRPVLDFILRYGPRLSEVFFPLDALRGDDVYVRERKNGLAHVITLLPEDAADLRARRGRAELAKLDTVWFREMKDGSLRPITKRGFQSACRAALDRAGVVNARAVHDGRHHAATVLLRLTRGNLAVVKELLGHEAISSTMRYAHTSREDVRDALRHAYVTTDAGASEMANENNVEGARATGT